MESAQHLIMLALQASIFLIVLVIGLGATMNDATYVLKRPGLLIRSVLSINVIVPLFAVLLALALPLSHVAKAGILLMAISPFPPFIPASELKAGGRQSYVYGLLVAISLLAIVIVPLTVALLNVIVPAAISISPAAVAKLVFTSLFLPMGIGMAIHRFAPAFSERAAPIISKIANIILIVAIIPVLIAVWPEMHKLIGNGTVLAIAAVNLVGLLAGHLLGGPDPRDRTVLAISSASRHPVIALTIATAINAEPQVKAAILLFVIVGLLVSAPYQKWRKRAHPDSPANANAPVKAE
ncbi:Na+-dependent transporter [Noviherbaspirillum cavernae]|uniref:Na+-dependent transporter n=1 Tax=Noviherbaspirillum cavernae TaxID=2320862 RepID=A0A418X1V4_9BURK|nr:Na+-dependent transporter [Noviherbaspirillum cavernae]RJG06430.1 Na+-dependent transporter [Noviherbaspirillum cavernae]